MDLQTQNEIQDELIEEAEVKPEISINERKIFHLGYIPKSCPYCESSIIRWDLDRKWYCNQCQAHESRIAPHIPVTDREKNEGKMYRKGDTRRPLHEFTCQYPNCDEKFLARKNGKNTQRYCDYHRPMVLADGRTRAGIAKRRLAYQSQEEIINV
jgi:ribosomal protein L37AE/L43A